MKICGITTKSLTLKSFMLDNLNFLVENGHEASVICKPDSTLKPYLGKVKFIPIDLAYGNVTPFELFKSVGALVKAFKREKFDMIQYATSNAALYAALAGWIVRTPVRIYCQWGISYTDYKGFKRFFYKTMEKLTCKLSTNVQPDSKSNLRFALSEHLYKKEKGAVIFNGSAIGVDLNTYDRTRRREWRAEILSKYNLPQNSFVFGFVGRLALEKGLNELLSAFEYMNDAYLFLVGPEYGVERLNQAILNRAKSNPRILFIGEVENAAKYHATFDYLILPSYREGFGMVVLEAAAVGTPAIVSRINGPIDLIKDGINGFICEVKSVDSLKKAMIKAQKLSPDKYVLMSENAYSIAKNKFDRHEFMRLFLINRERLYASIFN